MNDTLAALDKVLTERKQAQADSSYVASLYHKGLNKILEKVGEEAVEPLLAARDTDAGSPGSTTVTGTSQPTSCTSPAAGYTCKEVPTISRWSALRTNSAARASIGIRQAFKGLRIDVGGKHMRPFPRHRQH